MIVVVTPGMEAGRHRRPAAIPNLTEGVSGVARSGLDPVTPLTAVNVESRRLVRGCSAGLDERTAIVEIRYTGDLDRHAEERIRAGVHTLCPGDPLYGVSESDWPAAFLVDCERRHNLGDWTVALTVALQRWARDPVWRGRVLNSGPDQLTLAIPWRREQVFTDALSLAARLIELWSRPSVDPTAVQELIGVFQAALPSAQNGGLPPNTLRFVQAAVDRDIPFTVLPSFVQLGWGADAKRMDSSVTGETSLIGASTARNKFKTSRTLADAGVPMPTGQVVADLHDAERTATNLGWPVVVKPLNRDQGSGVVAGIRDMATLRRAFEAAAALSPGNVIIERHIDGDDHRLLIVAGRMLAAARRIPGGVTGDGVNTVAHLIDAANTDPRRGTGNRSPLMRLVLDAEALACLAEQGLDADTIAAPGREIRLRRTANVSTGGTAVDVTASVHPDNRALAERAARMIGLDIAGIDLLSTDISRSWRDIGGAICEVNAQPGFRPHWLADPARDINGEIVDILFDGRPGRIPTAAITGTNGKSTTALMLHHIWSTAGARTGVCTTAHVRIGDDIVSTENLSGFPGAVIVLNDPAVDAAVFEMPRKGLIYFGHPCDHYDVAALLNVQDDHLGVDGIETLEQMAELKAEVLQRATKAIVVNADDPLCLAMRSRAGTSRHILVAEDSTNATVIEHRHGGGEAVFLGVHDDSRHLILASATEQTPLMAVHQIPATMNGLLRFNTINAMFSAALAWAQGIDVATIRTALSGFHNSAEQNPGRYNFFGGLPFQLMLDYGHNPDGVREVCAVAAALPVTGRRVLCAVNIGNRHPQHVTEVGPVLAQSFDDFILGCDRDWIRRYSAYGGEDPAATALAAKHSSLRENGIAAERISAVLDHGEAVRVALSRARADDLLVILADPKIALPILDEFIRTRS